MKLNIFVTVFLFGSFFVGCNVWAANSDIIINEIGAYPTSTHEWIEIWNKGSTSVDLSAWKFWENATNHSLKAVTTTDGIISPGEFAVICQDADIFLQDYPNFVGSILDSSWSSLSENGEEIGLKDETGNFVEQFTYLPITKFSLERKDSNLNDYTSANWQENSIGNSVGFQNSNYILQTTSTETIDTNTVALVNTSTNILDWLSLKINEIISDPTSGNEAVELYNIGTTSIDLADGTICDSTQSNCKNLSGLIGPHDWVMADLLTDRYLNNDGDSVILKDPQGNIIDEVRYGTASLGAPGKDESLIRKIDGEDTDSDSDWAITTVVSEGRANELKVPVVVSNQNSGGGTYTNTSIAPSNQTATKTVKVSPKISTSTVVIDKVKMTWRLNWPYGLDINEVGKFDVIGTADPRGGEINFTWNFGDGVSSTGQMVEHAYVTSGVYVVSILASSTVGTSDKKELKVNVGQTYSVNDAQIKISDFQVTSTDSEMQYVGLINYLGKVQNISGWKIKDKSGKFYEIPEDTILSASGTLKFYRAVTHLAFDKDGDIIKLETSNGQEIDRAIIESEKVNKKELRVASVSINSAWHVAKGTVTALPDTLGKQIFYISDGEGGVQVYQYKKDFPDLKIGDQIEVSGEESEINGIKRIKIKNRYSIKILSSNKNFEAPKVDLLDFNENKLGGIVKVAGDITEIKSNFFYIDDGTSEAMIYWKKGRENKTELNVGDKVEITGIFDQTKDGFRILPRSADDIVVTMKSAQVLSAQKNASKATEREVAEKYLTATAGGLTTLLLGLMARTRGAVIVGGAKKIASVVGNIIKRG